MECQKDNLISFILNADLTDKVKLLQAIQNAQELQILLIQEEGEHQDFIQTVILQLSKVGGLLDEALKRLNRGGRVVICGASSQYNGNLNVGTVRGPSECLQPAERGGGDYFITHSRG